MPEALVRDLLAEELEARGPDQLVEALEAVAQAQAQAQARLVVAAVDL